jgi:2-polyprenyl-3-methyl-5-hydroxy-6-metoxy-1,4-benzoquinol methylase
VPNRVRGVLSPWLRARRIDAVRGHLRGRVLDLGCGVGVLADLVPADRYLGVDVHAASLVAARAAHPRHRFAERLGPEDRGTFDTAVSLAVIEHVEDPLAMLRDLRSALNADGRLVLTTPHRAWEWMHGLGAAVGLVSRDARDQHTMLFDESGLRRLLAATEMSVLGYRRFLLGVNQVVVAARPPGGFG